MAHFSLGPLGLEPQKLNTSHAKCKSSFIFAILLCVFEGRCHQVLYFTSKSASRQRHGLVADFKAPLSTPLEPLSASTVWGMLCPFPQLYKTFQHLLIEDESISIENRKIK